MRITNKIMQNNSLYNINNNKLLQDKLNTQIASQKTVNRPSDDPVIAIRSLRLRSNLNEVGQYCDKNIPDAESWLELTETAINTSTDIITRMIEQFQKGSKGSLTSADRGTILESLSQLGAEVYATGNADYAGRTIFTGYRTDSPLSFQSKTTQTYTVNEQMTNEALDSITYVNIGILDTLNETNFDSATMTSAQEVNSYEVHRLRLAYDSLDAAAGATIGASTGYDVNGNKVYTSLGTVTTMSKTGAVDPYRAVSDPTYTPNYNADAIIFVPETGELLLGKNAYAKIQALNPNAEIKVTYNKTEWDKGDLRPEHYFACESDGLVYNGEYLTKDAEEAKQDITYDVGFNQKIQVNTTADEVFKHGIGREVDEVVSMLQELESMDGIVNKLKAMKDNKSYDQDAVALKLAAAQKAQTYLSDTLQKKFESGITEMQRYLDVANLALTNVGNKTARLELIENRLGNQKTAFKTLTSENEDADVAELAIQLSSAELTYNAALAATGKVMETSLMNFI